MTTAGPRRPFSSSFQISRKKDKEVTGLYEAQKIQNQQAEKALNELRKEMQTNTDRSELKIFGCLFV